MPAIVIVLMFLVLFLVAFLAVLLGPFVGMGFAHVETRQEFVWVRRERRF